MPSTTTSMRAGTPEAMERVANMERAKREKALRLDAEARTALGEGATQEEVDRWVKNKRRSEKALKAQKTAKRLQGLANSQQREAESIQKEIAASASAPPSPGPTAPPIQRAIPIEVGPSLQDHPIFGASLRPGEVATVELHRVASARPEHNGPGVSPGYLDAWDFESFNQDAVRLRHGGGNYDVFAKNAQGRVLAKGRLAIAGRARPVEEEPAPESHYRLGTDFRYGAPQTERAPEWFERYAQDQEYRLRQVEALSAPAAPTMGALTAEEKFEQWKREQEVKEQYAQQAHERKMAELKATMEAETARRAAEMKATQDAALAREGQSTALFTSLLSGMQSQTQGLLTALATQKTGGGQMEMIAPLITAFSTFAKSSNEQNLMMLEVVRDMGSSDSGERRGALDKVFDFVEKRLEKGGDDVLKAIMLKVIEGKGQQPPPGAVPLQIPQGSQFRLPDGRVIPPEIVADYAAKYQAQHGQPPSMEVATAALTQFANIWAERQQEARAKAASQQVAQQGQQNAQAQESIRLAGQNAAAQATQHGATPEQANQAAQNAMRAQTQAIQQHLAQQQAAAQAQAQPQTVASQQVPTAPPPAVHNVVPPQVLEAARQEQERQAMIRASMVGLQAQAVAPVGVVPPPPPSGVATMTQEVAPSEVVSVPFMSRNFLGDVLDGFRGVSRVEFKHDPVAFLGWALETKRLSPEAKGAIGRVYEEALPDESLTSILTKIYVLLAPKGVHMPPDFVAAFKDGINGDAWLEGFLLSCSCSTLDEARKEIAEGPQE